MFLEKFQKISVVFWWTNYGAYRKIVRFSTLEHLRYQQAQRKSPLRNHRNFWSHTSKEVCMRYFVKAFLTAGHGRPQNIGLRRSENNKMESIENINAVCE